MAKTQTEKVLTALAGEYLVAVGHRDDREIVKFYVWWETLRTNGTDTETSVMGGRLFNSSTA